MFEAASNEKKHTNHKTVKDDSLMVATIQGHQFNFSLSHLVEAPPAQVVSVTSYTNRTSVIMPSVEDKETEANYQRDADQCVC